MNDEIAKTKKELAVANNEIKTLKADKKKCEYLEREC
jgi:hypothetical protein